MSIDEKNMDGDLLESATGHLRLSPIASNLSPELIHRTAEAMRLTRRKKTPWRAMALAACFLLAIGVAGWFMYRSTGEIAFAEVMQQVMQTKSFQATLIDLGNASEPKKSARLFVKGSHGRFETDDGLIIIDDAAGHAMTVDTKAHIAVRTTEPIQNNFDIYSDLRQIAAQIPKPIGRKNFAGHVLNGFAGTVNLDGKKKVPGTVWVDPRTRLPVRIELGMQSDGSPVEIIDDLRFDVPLNDSLFDMTVPKGYELRAALPMRPARPLPPLRTSRQPTTFAMPTVEIPLPPTPSPAPAGRELQKWVLRPGIGIGDLKFGATKEQIVRALGEPQGIMHMGNLVLLQYPAAGATLEVHSQVGLAVILAGAGEKLRVRPFAASTDKGVRIGSTRADIEAAYGKGYASIGVMVMNHPEVHQTEMSYSRIGLIVIMNSDTDRCEGLWVMKPSVRKASTKPIRRR